MRNIGVLPRQNDIIVVIKFAFLERKWIELCEQKFFFQVLNRIMAARKVKLISDWLMGRASCSELWVDELTEGCV